MANQHESKYYLVAGDMLPEIYIKVAKAKELIESGEVQTVSEAAAAVGTTRRFMALPVVQPSCFLQKDRGFPIRPCKSLDGLHKGAYNTI